MHLCQEHQDRLTDPHAEARGRTLKAKMQSRPSAVDRCGTCRRALTVPMTQLCESCAERDHLCQACSTSTLPTADLAELALQESYESLLDLATLTMKTCGVSGMREVFKANRAELGAALVDRFLAFDELKPLETMAFLDSRVKRPIWTRVLGPNVYRSRRCDNCAPSPRSIRMLIAAAGCGHLTPALAAAWCPLCAAKNNACETCGTSI
jgi:hypothetical protein